MKNLLLAIGVGAAAMSTTSGSLSPARRAPRIDREIEGRRHTPGVHRAGPAELAVRNRVAHAEVAKIVEKRRQKALEHAVSVPAQTWTSVGPTDAFNEYNSVDIAGVDSGRPNTILVDPRDPDIVYMGVSGGGVWKTFDFSASDGPHWSPATDLQPNLAVGALALDQDAPDTVYLGTGDFIDGSGNTILVSHDGGGTWSAPVTLGGMYPNGVGATVASIRSIAVHGAQVLVGTDAGMFASTDGGGSFQLVDLPNPDGKLRTEEIWTVLHLGGGRYVAAGIPACSESEPPPGLFGGPASQFCQLGNAAEIWTSPDGVTWTVASLPTDAGRLTLAAGHADDPAATRVYAYAASVDNFQTLAFWRSDDGGRSFVDATGTLANPTKNIGGFQDCESLNIGHDQSWYNQAIVVDPTNPDHVLVGGNLCGARTLNGTSSAPTWELVSHWLPAYEGGFTDNGQLPYVHADWHTATSTVIGGAVRTFAGTDGGIFSSSNLWRSEKAEDVTWTHHNKGLVTHLVYAIGSGDPTTNNPFVLFGGLQDNGTRFRADIHSPSVFNQPVGGDGIGATVHVASSGTTYWASVEFGHAFCQPSDTVDCAQGENWTFLDPVIAGRSEEEEEEARERRGADGDSEPFFVHYANVETDKTGQSVLTHTDGQIFVVERAADGTLSWKAISQDLTSQNVGFSNVAASRTVAGLYGASGSVSAKPFFVTTTGNTPSTWVAARPVTPTGTQDRLTGASSIDFPPVTPPGKSPGQVYIGSFTGTLNDAARTPPPDDKGHLYRTVDGGQTWTSIVGADPAHRLPNVAVYVAKYDPVTPTTIYAGTDLGVYITTDDGATWDRMGDGFPVVPARDIYVAKNQEFIRVATYGRGIWEIYPSATANPGAPGNGDYDRNLRIDWVDLAAMSSRLGDTPATAAPPFYTWIMDMAFPDDPPTAKIDDDDLNALLATFGGHP